MSGFALSFFLGIAPPLIIGLIVGFAARRAGHGMALLIAAVLSAIVTVPLGMSLLEAGDRGDLTTGQYLVSVVGLAAGCAAIGVQLTFRRTD